MQSFHIRPATVAALDHELMVDFQESQISWLSTIGSGDQWGRKSVRSVNPDISQRTRAWVQKSEEGHELGPEWCRAWVAEAQPAEAPIANPTGNDAESVRTDRVPVAALVLEWKSAPYVRSVLPEQDEHEPFVYLSYLISNREAGGLQKGVGAALIAFAKDQVRKLGVKRLCLDCWRGNERKLVSYYERQGFILLNDFTPSEKDWPGSVLEMRI